MNENKQVWDYFQNHDKDVFSAAGPRFDFLLKKAGHVKSGAISFLNIGAGDGSMEKRALAKGWDTHSLDLSEETAKNLKTLGIKAVAGSVTDPVFTENKFDVVVATEVLEHLEPSELPSAVKNILKFLKPGGAFIGTVPFAENLEDNRVYCPHCHKTFHRWGHKQNFTVAKLKENLLAHGFKEKSFEVRSFVAWRGRGVAGFVKSVARFWLGKWGQAIAAPHIYFDVRKE